jgi:predicted nucleic acid-binding protein
MTAFLDTNVLVRHLTGEPPAMAKRATRFLTAAEDLLLPDLILAEVAYVLESFYEVTRPRVAAILRSILAYPAIRRTGSGRGSWRRFAAAEVHRQVARQRGHPPSGRDPGFGLAFPVASVSAVLSLLYTQGKER